MRQVLLKDEKRPMESQIMVLRRAVGGITDAELSKLTSMEFDELLEELLREQHIVPRGGA